MSQVAARLKLLGISDRLIRRNPMFYGSARRLLERFDQLDPPLQRGWRQKRLRRILAAAGTTAYGRAHGASRRLEDWPLLGKTEVRANPDAFLSRARRMTVAASTSGTTGMPLTLRRSFESIAYEQAVLDWLVASAGIDPQRCRAAVLRGDHVKDTADCDPPFWRPANGGRRLLFSSNHLDSRTVGHFVQALRDYAPDAIFAYPTALESLCALMLQRGDSLRIPATICGSEALTRSTSEMARAALGTRVLDYYGQAERVAFAYGDPELGYRFLATYSMSELQRTQDVEDPDLYEVVGTSLWNCAMPLVRYRTGDRIRLRRGGDPNAVAAGRETFLEILGRSDDYLIAPSGARLIALNHVPRDVPRIVRAQFVQEAPDRVTLLVIPAPGFDDESRRVLLEHTSLKLPPSMRVRIETTAQLVRHRSGKIPLVVRKPGADDRAAGSAAPARDGTRDAG